MNTQRQPVLQMKQVTKEFPGVKALDQVHFNMYPGSVMALLGENGAGKSTLMKILAGVYTATSGAIYYNGKKVEVHTPKKAQEMGIAIIHQELNLIPELSAAENIFLGREPLQGFRKINWKQLYEDAEQYLSRLNMSGTAKTPVKEMSIGQQQMVEIAKALSLNAEIIIMDEPTDALTDKETEALFEVIRTLRADHKSVVYISHRLKEIFEICDDVTILRDGTFITECPVSDIDEDTMIEKMVGRRLDEQFPRVSHQLGDVVLKVNELTNEYVSNVSFELREGEILGIAGLMGAGRTELAKTLIGHYKKESGSIRIYDQEVDLSSPEKAIESGLVYVSEDRKGEGLVLGMSVRENISLSALTSISNGWGHLNMQMEKASADGFVDDMSIKTPSIHQKVRNLSGGNQQKVSIAKSLMTNPKVLILDEPTRGVDVGAKKEIYELINHFKQEGMSILMISSEIPEIIGMCDRVLVMHEGNMTGELEMAQITQDNIMRLAVGMTEVRS